MSRFAGSAFKGLAGMLTPSAGLQKGLGAVGRGTKAVGFDFSSPGAALAFGAPTALFAAPLLGDIGKSAAASVTGKPITDELKVELQRQRYQAAQAMKAQRLQKAMADNMMRLAAANPQLYNQLMVGRVLPQGAVVIGGPKRSDFLESVAYQMATGGFGNQAGTPDSPDMMQSLVDSY